MTATILLAEFCDADALLSAVRRTRRAGYRHIETFTPFPVDGLSEALALPPSRLRVAMLVAGLVAAALAYALQHWSAVYAYPINAGGRPLASWPAFLLVTFEVAVLAAAFAGFAVLIVRGDLTCLDHPVFALPAFRRASQDRFFLAIEACDPRFDRAQTRVFLEQMDARVHEVPP